MLREVRLWRRQRRPCDQTRRFLTCRVRRSRDEMAARTRHGSPERISPKGAKASRRTPTLGDPGMHPRAALSPIRRLDETTRMHVALGTQPTGAGCPPKGGLRPTADTGPVTKSLHPVPRVRGTGGGHMCPGAAGLRNRIDYLTGTVTAESATSTLRGSVVVTSTGVQNTVV